MNVTLHAETLHADQPLLIKALPCHTPVVGAWIKIVAVDQSGDARPAGNLCRLSKNGLSLYCWVGDKLGLPLNALSEYLVVERSTTGMNQ